MLKIQSTLFGELALIPNQPEKPVKEVLEWLTDIITSNDGSEERLKKRSTPRRFFSYKIPLQHDKKASIENAIYGAIDKNAAIPIWTEAIEIEAIVPLLKLIGSQSTLFTSLKANSIAISLAPNGDWEFLEIESVEDFHVILSDSIPASVEAGHLLIPLSVSKIVGNVKNSTNGLNSFLNFTFRVDDGLKSVDEIAPSSFLTYDVYNKAGLTKGGFLDNAFEKRRNLIDFKLGDIEEYSPWNDTRISKPYDFLLEDLSDVFDFKGFLQRRSGRFRGFWLPSFENDLRLLSSGLVETSFIVENSEIFDYGSSRLHISALDSSGVWHNRTITNITELSETQVQIEIDTSFNLQSSDFVLISYLGFNRFNADRIEFSWIGNAVSKVNLGILEINP